jgi:hypothetical protein
MVANDVSIGSNSYEKLNDFNYLGSQLINKH